MARVIWSVVALVFPIMTLAAQQLFWSIVDRRRRRFMTSWAEAMTDDVEVHGLRDYDIMGCSQ